MPKEITKDIVVIYHGQCRDGFTAAWAAWKKFGDTADYIPVIWTSLSEQIPELRGKEIYFLDYCPVQEKLDQMVKNNISVQVVDHHVSREKEAKNLPGSVFDITHSAAVLAWQFFHPNVPVPKLSLYVEDSDIWKWTIDKSAEVLDVIDLKGAFDFKTWDAIACDLEDPKIKRQYEEQGMILKQYRDKILLMTLEGNTQIVEFERYEVYAINAPRHFRSELGNILATRKPPFAIVWAQTLVEVSVSLRSVKEFDLIPIATKYGGGGHKNAANFRLPLDAKLPWNIITENEK